MISSLKLRKDERKREEYQDCVWGCQSLKKTTSTRFLNGFRKEKTQRQPEALKVQGIGEDDRHLCLPLLPLPNGLIWLLLQSGYEGQEVLGKMAFYQVSVPVHTANIVPGSVAQKRA
jgi:hypothetical protein